MDASSPEVIAAYMALHGREYYNPEHCQDSYYGEFDYYSDMREYIIERFYDCNDVPDHLVRFIDDDHVFNDSILHEFYTVEHKGRWYLFLRI